MDSVQQGVHRELRASLTWWGLAPAPRPLRSALGEVGGRRDRGSPLSLALELAPAPGPGGWRDPTFPRAPWRGPCLSPTIVSSLLSAQLQSQPATSQCPRSSPLAPCPPPAHTRLHLLHQCCSCPPARLVYSPSPSSLCHHLGQEPRPSWPSHLLSLQSRLQPSIGLGRGFPTG